MFALEPRVGVSSEDRNERSDDWGTAVTCAISNPPMERKNYVFVDYENVQEIDLDLIAGRSVEVFILVGHSRKTVPTELVCHASQGQVRWIASQGATKNALDLVLAFRIGQEALKDPTGCFHILSKDKDYDALIQHLRSLGIHAGRSGEFADIPPLSDPPKLSPQDQIDRAVEYLRKVPDSRPSKRKTLVTALHSVFRKQLPDAQIEEIVAALAAKNLIMVSDQGAVTYHFPK